MAIQCRFGLAVAVVLACALGVHAQRAYTTVAAALTGLKLSSLAAAAEAANLADGLADPDLQAIILAPTNQAFLGFKAPASASVLASILQYHIIPAASTSLAGNSTTLPTLLSGDISITGTTTITFFPAPNNTLYAGGVAPGALVDLPSGVRAGKSRVYLIDNILVPPVASLLGVADLPLTLNAATAASTDLSTLSSLSALVPDAGVKALLDSPDATVTFFAPDNSAFLNYLTASGQTAAALLANPNLVNMLKLHFMPIPTLAKGLPTGQVAVRTLAGIGSLNSIIVSNDGTGITVQAAGNAVPIPVIRQDIIAGKSVIHVIKGVLLPLMPTPPPAAGPAPLPGINLPPGSNGTVLNTPPGVLVPNNTLAKPPPPPLPPAPPFPIVNYTSALDGTVTRADIVAVIAATVSAFMFAAIIA